MDTEISNKAMLRGALIFSISFGIIALTISTAIEGTSGFIASSLATFTVVIYFSISLLVGRLTKNVDPVKTLAVALISYFTKLLVIAGFLIIVIRYADERFFDRNIFGLSAIFIIVGWLTGEVRAFFRLRLELSMPSPAKIEKERSA
ncbi:MAG: hypothetical protein ACKOOK_01605 [Actinomycetota bacterium]